MSKFFLSFINTCDVECIESRVDNGERKIDDYSRKEKLKREKMG